MAKQNLVKGAMILGVAGLVVKLLGAVFRLPLANMISSIGMANYSPAYYIYSFFLILSTSGIPIAISKMVSESRAIGNHYQAHKTFKLATYLMAIIGGVSFVILFLFADGIASAIDNKEAALAMRAIAPSLLIVPIMAAIRGYFQGMQNMKPTAVSQTVEQFFRVVAGLITAYIMYKVVTGGFFGENFDKYERGAAGASFGATVGSLGGLAIIAFIYYLSRPSIEKRVERTKNMQCPGSGDIIKKIIIIAVPITVGAAIMPIINLVDAGIVVGRLQDGGGFSYLEAKDLYGQLSSFVGPLVNLPQVLTQAVAMSIVPIVAEAYKLRDRENLRHNIGLGLKMTMIIGFPCAIGLFSLSQPILMLLYPAQKESAMSAVPILAIMAIGVIFLATVQILTGILQGIGKQMIPVRNLAIGVTLKIIITYTLTGISFINVKGAAFGTVTSYAIAAFLNILAVKKYSQTNINFMNTFGKPLFAAVIMGIMAKLSYVLLSDVLGNSIGTLLAVFVGVITYGVMVLIIGIVSEEEVKILPKGDKLASLIRKFKFR